MTREPFASLDLRPGTEYCSARHNCQNSVVVVCEATDAHTLQQRIVYKVLAGRDVGLFFVCSQLDFALRFERVKVETSQEREDVVADITDHGKGW